MTTAAPTIALVVRYPIGLGVLEAMAEATDRRAYLVTDPTHPFALAECVADAAGLPRLAVESFNQPEAAAVLAEAGVAAIVMCGGREILTGESLARLPPVYNVHPSLLPLHRGPTPLFWTLRGGDTIYGATVHRVTDRIDLGPLLLQRVRPVAPDATHDTLFEDAVRLCGAVAAELAPGLLRRAPLREVVPSGAPGPYERRPTRADLTIDAGTPCALAARLIRAACSPYTIYVPSLGFAGTLYPAGRDPVGITCADGEVIAYRSP